MLSIKENTIDIYEIKKSKFISYIFKVDNIEEVKQYLEQLKNEYKDATHICYAYIIENITKINDDGEPSGTAGMPILNVLKNKDLDHIMCCVVRYFGGIKLGAGGLVRAYTNSCVQCLNKTTIIQLKKAEIYEITFDYDNTKIINNILNNQIIKKEYNDKITYTITITDTTILEELKKYAEIKKIEECYIIFY